jgi:drug/metabolite transporter (DMT)-like permease
MKRAAGAFPAWSFCSMISIATWLCPVMDSTQFKEGLRRPGVAAALGAALLFGAGTPLAKQLLGAVDPWLLAGLLYLGSGIGLTLYRRLRRAPRIKLPGDQILWLAGAVAAGGVAGPVLLMLGLARMPASDASLLLNFEAVFTALLAWLAFGENFDRRVALGMCLIVAGAAALSWPGQARFAGLWPTLALLGACFAWGIDNNLTRKVALADATWVASVKGLFAGCVNFGLALALGAALPAPARLATTLALGFAAYGVSLALFVVGLRHLGAARTGAYFAVAPFFGALLALALGEPATAQLAAAGVLMALGVWLTLTERHEHGHAHDALWHEHEHTHDEHHGHEHPAGTAVAVRHTHWHRHAPLRHSHPHAPDAHHRHGH